MRSLGSLTLTWRLRPLQAFQAWLIPTAKEVLWVQAQLHDGRVCFLASNVKESNSCFPSGAKQS